MFENVFDTQQGTEEKPKTGRLFEGILTPEPAQPDVEPVVLQEKPMETVKPISLWEKVKQLPSSAWDILKPELPESAKGLSWWEIAKQTPDAIKETVATQKIPKALDSFLEIVKQLPASSLDAFGITGAIKEIKDPPDAWKEAPLTERAKLYYSEFGKNLGKALLALPRAAIQFLATPAIGVVEEITDTAIGDVNFPSILGDIVGPLHGTRTQVEGFIAQGYSPVEAKLLTVSQQMSKSLAFVTVFGAPTYIAQIKAYFAKSPEEIMQTQFNKIVSEKGNIISKTAKLPKANFKTAFKDTGGNFEQVVRVKGMPDRYIVVKTDPVTGMKMVSGWDLTDPALQIPTSAIFKNAPEIAMSEVPKGINFMKANPMFAPVKSALNILPATKINEIVIEETARRVAPIIKPQMTPIVPIPPVVTPQPINLTEVPPEPIPTKPAEVEPTDIIEKFEQNVNEYVRSGKPVSDTDIQPLNAALRDVIADANNPEVIKHTQEQVNQAIDSGELPVDSGGLIELQRVGEIETEDRLVSASYSKEFVETRYPPEVLKDRTITTFQVRSEDIKVFIGGGEAEVLVDSVVVTGKLPEVPQAPVAKVIPEVGAKPGVESKAVSKAKEIAKITIPETKLNTQAGKDALQEFIKGPAGGFVRQEDIPNLIKKLGNFSLIVKDVNGQRAKMNVEDLIQLEKNRAFNERVRSVFVNEQALPLKEMDMDDDFMEALQIKDLLKEPTEVKQIGELVNVEGIKLTNNSSITKQGAEKFIKMLTDNKVRQALKDNNIKEVIIEPPYKFSLSEQARIDVKKNVISINADATDPTQTIFHELGHQAFENLSNDIQDKLIENVKIERYGGTEGYIKLKKYKEAIADVFYTNEAFGNFLTKVTPEVEEKPVVEEQVITEAPERKEIKIFQAEDIKSLKIKELKQKLIEGPIVDNNEILVQKLGRWTSGFEKSVFRNMPTKFVGGYVKGVFTDAYVFINDKKITKEIFESLVDKGIVNKDDLGLYEDEFPDISNLPLTGLFNPAILSGYFAVERGTFILFTSKDGKEVMTVDADKFAFMRKYLPDADIMISSENEIMQFVVDKKVKGLLMGIKDAQIPKGLTEIIKTDTIQPYEQPKPTIRGGAGREVTKDKLSDTVQAGETGFKGAGEPTEKLGRFVAPRERAGGGTSFRERLRTRSGEIKLTNEEITELVNEVTKVTNDEVFLLEDLTEQEIELLNQYNPAGGKEREGAEGKGLLDEYYTNGEITDIMGFLASQNLPINVLDSMRVLEPSVGTGNFLNSIPDNGMATAYEVNPTTAKITKIFHPNTKVFNKPFETIFIEGRGDVKKFDSVYDLVIGNPPYGRHRGTFKGLGEEPKIEKYEDYFIKRSLDLTKIGGAVVMIVPSGFLRGSDSHAKREIYKMAELVDAYRLPNGVFENTDIGTDIVVFKKTVKENRAGNALINDIHFKTNPDKILGEVGERKSRFGMEQFVKGNLDDAIRMYKEINEILPATEVINKTEPEIKGIDKIDAITGAEMELGNVSQKEIYIKTRKKPINPPLPKLAKVINDKVTISTKKTAKERLDLKQFSTTKPSEKGTWENITSTGELIDKGGAGVELVNYLNGKWFNNFNYFQGDIYEKLDQLKANKGSISQEQYEKQRKGLEEVLPKRQTIDRVIISPNTSFVHSNNLIAEKNIAGMFMDWIHELPRDALGGSNTWDIAEYVDQQAVRGGDKALNNKIRVRRREQSDRLFKLFLEDGLTPEQQKTFIDKYNRTFNSYYRPKYREVPLVGQIHKTFRDNPLVVKNAQFEGIGFLVNKGIGLLAHDVGVGKTMEAIIATNETMQRGWAKKPLIIVPTVNVYQQWISEIQELLPDIKINLLSNLGGRFKGDLKTLNIDENTISIITYEGFKKLGFKDVTYSSLTSELQDVIKQPRDMAKNKTKRQEELEKSRVEGVVAKGIKGTKTEKFFEDLGFDHIVFDEAHNANHIISGAKLKEQGKSTEFRGLNVTPSELGLKTWLASQYVQKNNNGRNIFLLSATPFTNNPMEYYSVLSLMARDRLIKMGIKNVNDFMNMFMEISYDWEFRVDGSYKEKNEIKGFKNYQQFRNLLTEFIDFKDGEEAGIVRPERVSNEYVVKPTPTQIELKEKAQELFSEKYRKEGGTLKGITENRRIAFSPYASTNNRVAPSAEEFVNNSPKIKVLMDLIRQNKLDNKLAGQLIYSPIGVEFFPIMRDYLIKNIKYKPDEVAIISGGVSMDKRITIQEKFNSGDIKIIIGSDSIKEGVNLQRNTSDLYILSLPWNFTQMKQVVGRAWRQGNKWKRVRVNNIFTENSIDIFQSQKLSNKKKRYEAALTFKGDLLDVGDIDFETLKFDLVTDPVLRLELEFASDVQNADKKIAEAESEAAFFGRKAKKLEDAKSDVKDYTERLAEDPEDEYYIEKLKNAKKKQAQILAENKEKGIVLSELSEGLKEREKEIKILKEQRNKLSLKKEDRLKKAQVEKDAIDDEISVPTDYAEIVATRAFENKEFYELKDIAPATGLPGATFGDYSPIPIKDSLTVIQMPEMVKLIKELTNVIPFLKNYPKASGKFYEKTGRVGLSREIFKDPDLASKVLAHEIGHMIDWMPDEVMSRGTILGRILVLKEIRAGLLHDEKLAAGLSKDITNKVLREELWALSQLWRPMPESFTQSYVDYRRSSRELYADFISVLLNSPEILPANVPQFYDLFFKFLDRKPTIKAKYFELMDSLMDGSDNILKARDMDVNKMYLDGEQLFRHKMEIAKQKTASLWYQIKYNLFDKNIALLEKEKAFEKAQIKAGQNPNPEDRISYLLEETNFLGNDIKGILSKFNPIRIQYKDAGLTDEDFGKIIFFKRIVGDRSEIANPLGHNRNTAQKQLEFMRKELGEDKYHLLFDSVQAFQKLYKDEVLTPAYESGLINPETYEGIMASENVYGTFSVLKYLLEGYVSPSIIQQIGTLEAVANPLPATLLKMIAFRKATHINNTRKEIVNFLQNNFADEIEEIKISRFKVGGQIRTATIPTKHDKGILRIREDGKLRAFYVDPYIEKAFSVTTTDFGKLVARSIGFLNAKYFRPVYITFNIGFQSFNLIRDFTRTWKALPGANILALVKRYAQTIPIAKRRVLGITDENIKELEDNYVLGLTYNDIIAGSGDDLQQTEHLLHKYDVMSRKGQTRGFLKPIVSVLNKIKDMGDIIETMPKVVAWNYLKEKRPDIGIKERAHIVRSRAGTPDFTRKGALANVYNNIFLFSNIMKEGFRADFETGFKDPKTRSGFWFKTFMKDVFPKILMFLATAGYFGKKLQDGMNKATEYDKTNYGIVPIGETEKGQAIYLRIPSDETGRFIGALTWKLLNALKAEDKEDIAKTFTDVISYTGGQVPSLAPTIGISTQWGKYIMGQTPRDAFRDRDILTEDEMAAGGWRKAQPMLIWTLNNLGLLRMDVRDRVKDYSMFEKVIKFTPVINRFIKVTSYGIQEDLQKIKEKVERQSAIKRLDKKDAMVKYTEKYLNSETKNFDVAYGELASAVYGGETVTQAKLLNLKKEFASNIVRAKDNPYVNELIYTQTIEQQVIILRKMKATMPIAKVNKIGQTLIGAKIITIATWNQAMLLQSK